MSYNPTQWYAGDTVTSAKLNKIEQGISNNGVLEINAIYDAELDNLILDKTWQEIYNANGGTILLPNNELYSYKALVQYIGVENGTYNIGIITFYNQNIEPMIFTALAADGHPALGHMTQAPDPSNTSPINAN